MKPSEEEQVKKGMIKPIKLDSNV